MMMKLTSLLAAVTIAFACGNNADAAKPNIVLINADDLGWAELGCYGQEKIKTPNLDKLASQGQRWTQFYSGAPVCSPSRNVLMTGCHTGQTDVQDLKRVNPKEKTDDLKGDWPITKKAYTLPEAMKKAGYDTGVFGKWGLGEFGTSGAPDKHGIDRFYGYTDQRMCHTYYPPFLWNDGKKEVINTPGIPGHMTKLEGEVRAEDYRGQTHSSDLIADKMLEYVKEKAKSGKSFFLYYAPLEPHVAMQPLQMWVDVYPREWDKQPYRGRGGYLPHPRPRAAYAGMISQMDANVGRLMKALHDLGLDENTVVIFTSDNGTTHDVGGVDHRFFNSVAGLRGLKGSLHEGGIRVPGIIRWTGKIKPDIIEQPAYAADIMPTLCRLADADAGKPAGIDLSPVVLGKQKSIANRRPMVWAGGGYGGQVAVRIGDMKVMRKDLLPGKMPKDWEVYNLADDPTERTNLAESQGQLIEQAINILDEDYKPSRGFPALRYKEATSVKK